MKRFVVYKEEAISYENTLAEFYLKENGDYTPFYNEAKMYQARNWIELVIKILQVLLTVLGNKNLKWREVK